MRIQVTTSLTAGGRLESMLKQVRSLAAALLGFTAVVGPWLTSCEPVVETAPAEEPEVQEAATSSGLAPLDEPRDDTVSRTGLGSDSAASVLVAVRDAHGRMVPNIPVAPTRLLSDGQTIFIDSPVQTGPDGIAMVPMRWGLWEQYEGKVYVEVLGILVTPVRRGVSEHGVGRVDLCVPEMGEVIVSTPGTSDAKDARRPKRAVELWQGDRPMGNLFAPMHGANRHIRQGPSHFFHIETGQQLSAGILRGGLVEGVVSFRGPSTAGEVVRISLERDGPGLTGRLVDEHGRPLANVTGTAHPSSPRYGPAIAEFCTDAEGVLRWTEFRRDRMPQMSMDELVFVVARTNPQEAPWVPLYAPVPIDWPGKPVALGTLTIQRLERVAEGIVLDEGGSPIAGAQVGLEWKSTTGRSWARVRVKGLRMVVEKSDADGAFTVFARCEPGDYRLVVSAEGFLRKERALASPGLVELELVLAASASLVGDVLVGPGLNPSVLRIEITHASGMHAPGGAVDRDGRFRVVGIPPGSVEPRIVLPNGQTVAVMARTELTASQEVSLGTIDLRGQVFSRVVSIFGKRAPRAVRSQGTAKGRAGDVVTNFPNNPGLYGKARGRDGRVVGIVQGVVDPGPGLLRITSVTESVEVKIKVVGFRETDWLTISGDQEVTLVAEDE